MRVQLTGSTIKIPEDLTARIEQLASKERLSPEELVHEAVEKHLRRKRLQDLYSFGEGQARKVGINPEDVDGIVREERDKLKLGR